VTECSAGVWKVVKGKAGAPRNRPEDNRHGRMVCGKLGQRTGDGVCVIPNRRIYMVYARHV